METFLIILIILLTAALIWLYTNYQKTIQEKNNLQNQAHELISENTSLKSKTEQKQQELQQHLIELSQLKEKITIQEKILSDNKTQIEYLTTENKKISTENARYTEQIQHLQNLLQTQKQEIQNIQEQLKKEFELISSKLLQQNTQQLTQQNQQVLSTTIAPVKEYLTQLKDIEQKIQRYYDNENKDRASLKTIIEELNKRNDEVKQSAQKLVDALTKQVKYQGNWGEMILQKLLELSGLHENIEYVLQQKDNDKQPDVIINLPNDKHIIIDAKVTLAALAEYHSAPEEKKNELAKDILTSVENHYNTLSKKEYEKIYSLNSIDFVLMFIPIESVMTIIQQYNPELYNDAVRKRVLIVTPTSLLATLKTIYFIWQQEKRRKEFENILQSIEQLYDKLRIFIDHFTNIEKHLQNAHTAYEDAKKTLIAGKGNAMSIIDKKIKPYINPKKPITQLLPENDPDEN